MTGVQVWGFNDVTQQVPFFLQRTCEEWLPKTLKSDEDSLRAGLWLHLNLFNLLTVLLSLTFLSRGCQFLFLYWPACLILSYPAGCQHQGSMFSVYPSNLHSF